MTVAHSRPMHCALQLAAIGLVAISLATVAQAQVDRYDALANAPFSKNRPTPETSKLLEDELLVQRNASLPLGDAADQHARHEDRVGKDLRRRL
jgi:hypothetical protein